jgi:hypothetical protein
MLEQQTGDEWGIITDRFVIAEIIARDTEAEALALLRSPNPPPESENFSATPQKPTMADIIHNTTGH